MLRHAGMLSLLTVPTATFIAFVLAEPQIQLRGRIWAGELRTQAVPVVDFHPPASAASSRAVRIDGLSFQVPADEPEAMVRPSGGCVWIRTTGLAGLVFKPVPVEHIMPAAEYLDLTRLPRALVRDPAALRAAAYAAGSRDLSIWMSPSDVDTLTGLLEAKTMLCASATRVEWIRNSHLSGVLIIREREDAVYMTLEYFSPVEGNGGPGDGPVGGSATLVVDAADPRAMNLARALIGSFALD